MKLNRKILLLSIISLSILLSIGAISANNSNLDVENTKFQSDGNSNLFYTNSNPYLVNNEINQNSQSCQDSDDNDSNLIYDNNEDISDNRQNSKGIKDSQNPNMDNGVGSNSYNQNILADGEIPTVVVSTWTELKSYAESTSPIIITLKDNTQFTPTGTILIKSNITIIGSDSSFIGGTEKDPIHLTGDFITLDGGDISINLINLTFKYMNDFFIVKISSDNLNTFENCSFISNYNGKERSSIVYLQYGYLNMFNTRFINNTAQYGTVANYNPLSVENVHMNLTNCIFDDNYSLYIVGGINNCGYLNVQNSSFSRNRAPNFWAGAIHSHSNAITIVNNTNFTDNFAGWQGGAICNYGRLEVYNSNFIGNNNTGTYGGAAIFACNYESVPYVYILNSTFINNTELTKSASGGAVMYMDDGEFSCINCTFISNNASRGQAIYVTQQAGYGSPNVLISGNKFINHTGAGDTMFVNTNKFSVKIIANNTYENSRILFKDFNITCPETTYNVNSNIRFSFTISLTNPLSYDEDILRKAKFDIYVDGVKNSTVSYLNPYFYLNMDKEGLYTVNVASSQFYVCSNNIALKIIKGEIIFINPVSIIDYGDILNLSLKVYDTINKSYFTSGDINIIIMDNRSTVLHNQTYKLENETFNLNLPIYSRFDFSVMVSFYKEDYGYINNTLNIQMNPESVPINITINANNLTIYYTNISYLTFNLLNYTDPIAGAEVTFTIDKTFYNMTTDDNGYINLKLPTLNIGTYDVSLKYADFEKNITITVQPIPFKFKSVTTKLIKGQYFKATLTDLSCHPLAKQAVTIKIGSTVYHRNTNSKGVVSLLVNFNPKTYNLKLTHDFYSVSSKLKVNKIPIKFTSITKTVKRGGYFKLRVIDTYKKAVKSKVIIVKIKSKQYKVKTNSQGYIKIKIGLKPGKYKVSYKLSPDKIYGGGKTSGSTTIRVKR